MVNCTAILCDARLLVNDASVGTCIFWCLRLHIGLFTLLTV